MEYYGQIFYFSPNEISSGKRDFREGQTKIVLSVCQVSLVPCVFVGSPPIISPGKKSWKWSERLWKNLFRFRRVPFTTTVDEPGFRVNCKQPRIEAKVASLTIRKTPRNFQICHAASSILTPYIFCSYNNGNKLSLDSSYIIASSRLMCLLVFKFFLRVYH